MPDSIIRQQNEFNCIIGAKTHEKLGLIIEAGKPPTIDTNQDNQILHDFPKYQLELLS
jgi:hypothetical protein